MTRTSIRKYLVSLRSMRGEYIEVNVYRAPHNENRMYQVLSELYLVEHLIDTRYREELVDTFLNFGVRSTSWGDKHNELGRRTGGAF